MVATPRLLMLKFPHERAKRLFLILIKPGAFMNFEIEFDQEEDGRWIAEIPELPGVIVYGETPVQAKVKAKALALRVLAERIENDEPVPVFDWKAGSIPRCL
jgi:predicted RNase H-like HicB family nuclease